MSLQRTLTVGTMFFDRTSNTRRVEDCGTQKTRGAPITFRIASGKCALAGGLTRIELIDDSNVNDDHS